MTDWKPWRYKDQPTRDQALLRYPDKTYCVSPLPLHGPTRTAKDVMFDPDEIRDDYGPQHVPTHWAEIEEPTQ